MKTTSHSIILQMQKVLPLLTIVLSVLVFAACSENPVSEDDHELEIGDLEASLTVVEDHVHTLSPATFQVDVLDHHGDMVTDLEQVTVQRRLAGDETWRDIELTLAGNRFEGTYTFASSGEYDLRVAGMLHGMMEPEVMMQHDEPLQVGRAHVEAAGYRIEFENYPGHLHTGDTAALQFFVLEEDAQGTWQPVSGIASEIHCGDPDGSTEVHTPVEVEPGVYEAQHTFDVAGDAHPEFHFTDHGGTSADVDFHISIAHGH